MTRSNGYNNRSHHRANVTWARNSENDYPSTQVDHLQTRPQVVYLHKHGTTTQVPQIRHRHNSQWPGSVIHGRWTRT